MRYDRPAAAWTATPPISSPPTWLVPHGNPRGLRTLPPDGRGCQAAGNRRIQSQTATAGLECEPPLGAALTVSWRSVAKAQIGLICGRPAWLTLLTDVWVLPRVARLGITQDVFRWSVVVHTRIVPPAGCRPLCRRQAEASARTCRRGACWVSIVVQIQRPADRRPAPSWPAAARQTSHGLASGRGRTRGIKTTARLPAKCLPALDSVGLSRG